MTARELASRKQPGHTAGVWWRVDVLQVREAGYEAGAVGQVGPGGIMQRHNMWSADVGQV